MAKAPITPIDAEIEGERSKRRENTDDHQQHEAKISDKANEQKDRPHPPGGGSEAERQPS